MLTESEYKEKMCRIDVLLRKGLDNLNWVEDAELDALSEECEEYEEEHFKITLDNA